MVTLVVGGEAGRAWAKGVGAKLASTINSMVFPCIRKN